jgi:caspase domain-containing protein
MSCRLGWRPSCIPLERFAFGSVRAALCKLAPAAGAPASVRIALVIGNSNYLSLPKLPNPAADARAVAAVLKQMGYTTQLVLDAPEQDVITQQQLPRGWDEGKADWKSNLQAPNPILTTRPPGLSGQATNLE